jgi:dihydroorotase
VIVSSHSPQDTESKRLEFDLAEFGMIGLQTFYPVVLRKSGEELFLVYLRKFTQNPRRLLGLPIPIIREGEKANITVFDPDLEWVFNESTNFSKSANSPLMGRKLKGKVIAAFNNGRSHINP